MPLSWALALKTENGQSAMFGTAHLETLGYLQNPVSEDNPFGLPVGFVVDHDASRDSDLMCAEFPETCKSKTMREPWIGLNCSACHTAEFEHNDTRFRIDGAPANANFDGLVNGVEDALQATLQDDDRFQVFAQSVLGGSTDPNKIASLVMQVEEHLEWMSTLRNMNDGAVVAGPARLDAQGHILNKVALVNGAATPSTDMKSDAPASYPFIWNTHQQAQLQWNGIAGDFLKIPLAGRTTDIGALVRNTSEVIGVFGHIEADRKYALLGYDSSVRVTEMVGLERLLSQLQSPQWPENILGPIDRTQAARGHDLFEQNCRDCHAHLDPTDLQTPANDMMVDLNASGTDVFLACNTFLRRTQAGNMEGQRTIPVIGEKITETDATHKMLVNASLGAIFGKLGELGSAIANEVEPQTGTVIMTATPNEILPGVTDIEKKRQAEICLMTADNLLRYKARPLNGIWATAPYLHNGSVPTLYDLLLPARARNIASADPVPAGPLRPESFAVGSRRFDAGPVGFGTEPGEGRWMFEVRDTGGGIIPGNSNAGHDYGNADFSEEDRLAIVEYLKSL